MCVYLCVSVFVCVCICVCVFVCMSLCVTVQSRMSRVGSFGRQFAKPAKVAEQTPKISVNSRKPKNKFSLSELKNGKYFWEELQQQKAVGTSVGKRNECAGRDKQIEDDLPATILDVAAPVDTCVVPANSQTYVKPSYNSSFVTHSYVEEGVDVLTLCPSVVSLQHELTTARSVVEVLQIVNENLSKMDPIHLCTSLHRMARLKGVGVSLENEVLCALVSRIENTIQDNNMGICPQWTSNVFWALSKLGWEQPDFIYPFLLKQIPGMNLEQVGSCMYAVAPYREAVSVVDALVQMAASQPIVNHHQLVSICTSLARIGRVEPILFRSLSDSLKSASLDSISMDDFVSVLWAFTKLKITDSTLFSSSQIGTYITQRIDFCSPRNLVDIAWSVSKSGRVDSEFFKYTLAPVIRSHIPTYSVRELCTILWSFANGRIVDPDFYTDVANALLPNVYTMNAHDVSSVIWAMGSIGFKNGKLHEKLQKRAIELKSEFTPLQLTRVIYGWASCTSSSITNTNNEKLQILANQASRNMHLLYTQNMVEILIGLDSANCVEECGLAFLTALEKSRKISGRDAVQILRILSRLPVGVAFPQLASTLEEIVCERFNCSGRWIPTGYDVLDLLESVGTNKPPKLLELALGHLATVCKSPSFTLDLFCRLVSILSLQPPIAQMSVSKYLLLEPCFSKMTEKFVTNTHLLSFQNGVEILQMFAKIGYCDVHIERFANTLVHNQDMSPNVSLLTSFAQLGIKPEWTFAQLAAIEAVADGNDAIDIVWSRLALGDDPRNIPFTLFENPPHTDLRDLHRTRQVCFSVRNLNFGNSWKHFADDVSAVRKDKLPKPVANTRGVHRAIDKYSVLISVALNELGVKHIHEARVCDGMYTVTARIGDVIVDLANPREVVSPAGMKFRGDKILKNIHLGEKLGLNNIVNLRMNEVHTALVQNGNLNAFIADLIAPFNDKCKERVSFSRLNDTNNRNIIKQVLNS